MKQKNKVIFGCIAVIAVSGIIGNIIVNHDSVPEDPAVSTAEIITESAAEESTSDSTSTVIPDVTNLHFEYAKEILEQENFVVQQEYEISSEGLEASKVTRTEPAAGEQAETDSTIIVYVSRGEIIEYAELPDMVGDTLEHAKTICEYYGLKVTAQGTASTEAENIVIAQSIAPGEKVTSGTEIMLTYSSGQELTVVMPSL